MNRPLLTVAAALLLFLGWQYTGSARTILLKRVPFPDRERLVLSGLAPSARVAASGDVVDVTCPSNVDHVSHPGTGDVYLDGVALVRPHLLFLLKPGVSASIASEPHALAFDLAKAHLPDQRTRALAASSRPVSSPAASSADRALVPGLPSPFLATVEGQVSRLIAKPLRIDIREVTPGAATLASGGMAGPTSPPIVDTPAPATVRSILWPVPSIVGVAALRRAGETIVYFDTDKPIGSAGRTNDPVFDRLRVEVVAGVTRVRLPVAASTPVRLERTPEGWRMTVGQDPVPRPAVSIVREPNRITFPIRSPGTSIVTRDPVSGATLLVGTVRRDCAELGLGRATALFTILPTSCGVIVDARSDRLVLRTTTRGFSLESGDDGALHAGPPFAVQPTEARLFTRLLRPEPTASIADSDSDCRPSCALRPQHPIERV